MTSPTRRGLPHDEDYLTARAANPRTGLISPSLHVSTPYEESQKPQSAWSTLPEQQSPLPNSPKEAMYQRLRRRLRVAPDISAYKLPRPHVTPCDGLTASPNKAAGATLTGCKQSRADKRPPNKMLDPILTSIPPSQSTHDELLGFNVPLPTDSSASRNYPQKPPTHGYVTPSLPRHCCDHQGGPPLSQAIHPRTASLPVMGGPLHISHEVNPIAPKANEGHRIWRKPVPSSKADSEVFNPCPDELEYNVLRRSCNSLGNLYESLPRINLRRPSQAARPRFSDRSIEIEPRKIAANDPLNVKRLTASKPGQVRKPQEMVRPIRDVAKTLYWKLESAPVVEWAFSNWRAVFNEASTLNERLAGLNALLKILALIWLLCLAIVWIWNLLMTIKDFFRVVLQPVYFVINLISWLSC